MKNTLTLFLIVLLISCDDNPSFKSILESNDVEKIKLKRKPVFYKIGCRRCIIVSHKLKNN